MEDCKFEVGKFYLFGVGSYSGAKRIPAKCVKVMKRKVFFEHLARDERGVINIKTNVYRWLRTDGGVQVAYVSGTWNTTPNTYATDVCKEPDMWRSVK